MIFSEANRVIVAFSRIYVIHSKKFFIIVSFKFWLFDPAIFWCSCNVPTKSIRLTANVKQRVRSTGLDRNFLHTSSEFFAIISAHRAYLYVLYPSSGWYG